MIKLSSSFSLKVLVTFLGVSLSIAHAMEKDTLPSSPISQRKRSFDEFRGTEEESTHGQVFARATLDPVAKYVLDDPEVLKGFIQTFAGISEVEIIQILDNNLNPLERKYSNLYEAFNKVKPKLKKMMEDDKEGAKNLYKVEKRLTEDASYVKDEGLTSFLYELARHQDDLSKIFPDPKRPQVDVLCKFSQLDESNRPKEELALIEIQVAQQDYWDQRGLAYAALIYGNQLRRSEEWSKLKNVIAINILGGGVSNVKYWQGGKYVRHYQFQDKHDSHNVMPYLQVIQYSLGDADLDSEEFNDERNKNLKDWLDFYRNGHRKEEVPEGIDPDLEKAYKRIKFDQLPEEIREFYEKQLTLLENFKNHEAAVREEAKAVGLAEGKVEGEKKKAGEIARNMLKQGLDKKLISQLTGFSEEEIEKL